MTELTYQNASSIDEKHIRLFDSEGRMIADGFASYTRRESRDIVFVFKKISTTNWSTLIGIAILGSTEKYFFELIA